MREFCIVILNHFPEYARNLIASIKRTHTVLPEILVICDRHQEALDDCKQRFAPGPFVFSKNTNMGFDSMPGKDIILLNDDMECVEKEFFPNLVAISYKYKDCGILSPLIDGGVGNELQQYPPVKIWKALSSPEIIIDRTVCFPCVYIKREMIDEIGGLDGTFVHYGFDDDDYCIRARAVGWRTMITKSLHIKHGSGGSQLLRGSNWSCSFAKVEDPESNIDIFLKKYPQLRAK